MISCKGIDPLGALTRSGEIACAGAIIFHDVELSSQNDVALSQEAVKSLFDVNEAASVPARYHMAILPRCVPRMFSVNSGVRVDTNAVDYGRWFELHGLTGAAELARGNYAALGDASDQQLAILRRLVVFWCDRATIGLQTADLARTMNEDLEEELAIEAEALAELA